MNKNAQNVVATARRMDVGMDGKVIDARRAVMYSRIAGENGRQMNYGMNIAMNERRTVLSQKTQNGA